MNKYKLFVKVTSRTATIDHLQESEELIPVSEGSSNNSRLFDPVLNEVIRKLWTDEIPEGSNYSVDLEVTLLDNKEEKRWFRLQYHGLKDSDKSKEPKAVKYAPPKEAPDPVEEVIEEVIDYPKEVEEVEPAEIDTKTKTEIHIKQKQQAEKLSMGSMDTVNFLISTCTIKELKEALRRKHGENNNEKTK